MGGTDPLTPSAANFGGAKEGETTVGQFFERLVTAVVALAALAVGSSAVRREFFPRNGRNTVPAERLEKSYVPNWDRLKQHGKWYGDSMAAITIVEFLDYECPFCARFHETLQATQREVNTPVALRLVQFPLPMHRFAVPAAVAAECASKQGRFGAMSDVLLARQDSFGLKSWTTYAAEAGVRDTIGFSKCVKSQTRERIDADRAVGESISLRGTPTVVINGWRYSRAPTAAELREVLKRPPQPPNSVR
jgi:protein-disulfide isomerase